MSITLLSLNLMGHGISERQHFLIFQHLKEKQNKNNSEFAVL